MASNKDDDERSVSETTPLLNSANLRLPSPCPPAKSAKQRVSPVPQRPLPPYSGYGTADWLGALVQGNRPVAKLWDAGSSSSSSSSSELFSRAYRWWRPAQSWVAAIVIGVATALVAFVVDVSVETVSDWKTGRCASNFWLNKRACCAMDDGDCGYWMPWAARYRSAYAIYVLSALLFGIIASALSMTTKRDLVVSHPSAPSLDPRAAHQPSSLHTSAKPDDEIVAKTMLMATGSGIPEIKSVLSGFDIPHLLTLKVLGVKSLGAVFAVATAMCLGKEGPFVHISACIGHLATTLLPDYAGNAMKARELLSIACSAGLSVAFGAPIGGVLFSYEEISTYFPRRVLLRAFLCSLVAAMALKELNPMGTGSLVLFETNYGVNYDAKHYLVFIILGVCGGVFGGVFCYVNFLWSRTFRQIPFIKKSPVLEVCIVVAVTALLQYPNPLIRETGDKVMERLLVDCNSVDEDWICAQEAKLGGKGTYYALLVSGTLVKLLLTIVTFGCKVPSGVIIPALDAGALFGRMVGQLVEGISPGIFAMVGSAAFLAGVSRMTVSLAVIMFELTGEVNFIPPFMVAILTAKWVADYISTDGVYDLAQRLAGHPFLDAEQALEKIRRVNQRTAPLAVEALLPPPELVELSTLRVDCDRQADMSHLRGKLVQMRERGVLESGFAMTNPNGICCGYISSVSLAMVLGETDKDAALEQGGIVSFAAQDLLPVADANPLCVSAKAPIEHALEMFSKLGLGYLTVVDGESSRFVGIVTRKDLLRFLDSLA